MLLKLFTVMYASTQTKNISAIGGILNALHFIEESKEEQKLSDYEQQRHEINLKQKTRLAQLVEEDEDDDDDDVMFDLGL